MAKSHKTARQDALNGQYGYTILVELTDVEGAKNLVDGKWFRLDAVRTANGVGATMARRKKMDLEAIPLGQRTVHTDGRNRAFTNIRVAINLAPCKHDSCPPQIVNAALAAATA
jgi:hypothetical protein